MKPAACAALLFCCSLAFSQSGQGQIDPRLLLGKAPMQTPGERAHQQSDAFSAASDSVLEKARSSYFQYQAETKNEEASRARAAAARRKQMQLQSDKDRAVEELLRGEFCSGCGQTRSQILAKGEPFPHPGQQIIIGAASPQQIAAKKQEFDGLISNAKGEERQALLDADAAAQRKQADAQDVILSFVEWKEAMLAEDEGRAHAWDQAVDTYRQRFNAGIRAIQSLDDAIARVQNSEPKQPSVVAELNAQRDLAREMMGKLSKQVEEDYFEKNLELAEFNDRLSKGRSQLEQFVDDVGGPFLGMHLPNMPSNLPIPGTPFGIGTKADSLEFKAKLGMFTASLRMSNDFLRNQLNVDLLLGVDSKNGLAAIGMRRTTRWGPNGTTMSDTPIYTTPKMQEPPDPLELLKSKKNDNPSTPAPNAGSTNSIELPKKKDDIPRKKQP